MNLFFREVRRNRNALMIWTASTILINVFLLSTFPSVAEMAAQNEMMLSQYSEEFVKALSLDKLNITNILDFYASRAYLLLILFGSIYASILASGILSKEESEKTIEFLVSKPITRSSIVTSKLACVVFNVTALNLVFSISNYIFMNIFKTEDFHMKAFMLISLAAWLVHLYFALIGLVLSAFTSKTRTALSASIGIVFISFFFSILASLEKNLSFLKYLNPFSFFRTEDLVVNMQIQGIYLLLTISILAAATFTAYFFYSRKDITA